MDIQEQLAEALAYHRSGRVADAERVYRHILHVDAGHLDALYLLGLAGYQTGRNDLAVVAYKAALCVSPGNGEISHNIGIVLKGLGRFGAAIAAYKRTLRIAPDHAEALYNIGNALISMGRLDEAARAFRTAILVNPGYAPAYANLGNVSRGLGYLEDGLADYKRSIHLKPDFVEANANLGVAYKELGRLDDAVGAHKIALCLQPDRAEPYCNIGVALTELGRIESAKAACGKALRVLPDYAEAHCNLGNVLRALGRLDDAIAAYDSALGLKSDYAEAHSNRGITLGDMGRLDEALMACRTAICVRPDLAASHSNLGILLQDLGRAVDAVAANDVALCLKPDYAEARSNKGVALKELGRHDDALMACRAALDLKPDHAGAQSNLGNLLKESGALDDAVAAYTIALRLDPDSAEAHYNRSLAHLSGGNLGAGWPGYEWRWKGGSKKLKPRGFAQPQWVGEDIAGRRILLHAEQGFGDTIQFCRYAPLVAARGAVVIIEAPRSLLRLLSGLEGVTHLVAAGDPLPDFDCHCPLMSLPLAFKTRVETIPASRSYLAAEEEKVARWRVRIGPSGLRVGIAWQGSPTYKGDNTRSIPLACFAPLAQIPGVRLISLQKRHGLDQLESLPPGMRVETLGADFDEGADAFIDSAAVMINLDLIITADTAIGHLGGALGRPVWLALTAVPHWVWMSGRDDTPWYPNTRLFRQTLRGDWQDVFKRMAAELQGGGRIPAFHCNQGVVFQEQGRLDEAVASYRLALAHKPELAEAHYNLGIALKTQGKVAEASVSFIVALICRPGDGEAYNNLGIALQEQGRSDDAVACFGRSLACDPRYAEAHNNLGIAHQEQGRLEEAMACYRQALTHKPDYASAYFNLGVAFQERSKPDKAVTSFERALTHQPDYAQALSYMSLQSLQLCDWRGLGDMQDRVLGYVRRGQTGVVPFSLLVLPSTSADQLACATTFSEKYRRPASTALARTARHGDKIRIGYLSADYQDHATAHLIAELIERHDRHLFEISGYSLGRTDDGLMRRRLMAGFDRFVDVRPLSFRGAAERIHQDEIDILVDLKGYTQDAKTGILAFRPSPIQVNFLGYPGTMGADFIDYIIADRFCIPSGHEAHYSEKIIRLPDSYQPNDTQRLIAERTPSRAESGLPDQGFVFCCFNNSVKLSPLFFDMWMRLLVAVPGSVLWLLETNDGVKANLGREAFSRGVNPARLVFAPRQPLPDHLARHRLADLFLDTLPCNAHTTASDALWAGLPVLTCAGQTFAGRVGASLLGAAGLPELITETMADYEALAWKLATDPEALRSVRERLRTTRDSAPLFDGDRYRRSIETAYLHMWRRWRDGQSAVSFDVLPERT